MFSSNIKRLREILIVFFENGFDYLIGKIHLSKYIPLTKRLRLKIKKEADIHPAVRLRKAFEQLGPSFVKLGQILSLRPDLIPEEYIKEFEKMQDKAPAFSFKKAREIVESELKLPITKLFKKFDNKPIAAASLAQVHKAVLKNNKIVAVKIQRPNIQETIAADISIMLKITTLIEKYLPEFATYRLKDIVTEFAHWTNKELNFKNEELNLKIFRKNFESDKNIIIPKVYSEYSTEKVLVMDFIDGIAISNLEELKRKKRNIVKALNYAYEAILKQIFEHGIFHGDPHPGNILVLKNNKIAFIDFGIIGRLDEKLKIKALKIFNAIIENDVDTIVKTFISMGLIEGSIDRVAFTNDIDELVGPLQYYSLKDIEVGKILQNTLNIAFKYKIKVPSALVLFGKTVVTLEGVGLRYNPNFRLIEQSKPILKRIVQRSHEPKKILKKVKKRATFYAELIEELPEYTSELFEKIKSGTLKIDIEDKDVRSLSLELEHSSGNLSLGLIVASLIVGASLLIRAGFVNTAFFGLGIAAILSFWLVHRTIFAKIVR
ncbi:MAG: ABC1 kinase family protein [Candidatus Helarchaeota archaeon]